MNKLYNIYKIGALYDEKFNDIIKKHDVDIINRDFLLYQLAFNNKEHLINFNKDFKKLKEDKNE